MSYEIQAMNGDSQVHQLLSIKEPDQKKIHATANPATNGWYSHPINQPYHTPQIPNSKTMNLFCLTFISKASFFRYRHKNCLVGLRRTRSGWKQHYNINSLVLKTMLKLRPRHPTQAALCDKLRFRYLFKYQSRKQFFQFSILLY